jgi:hypothetical protein
MKEKIKEIVYRAIREIAGTEDPFRFAVHDDICYDIAVRSVELAMERGAENMEPLTDGYLTKSCHTHQEDENGPYCWEWSVEDGYVELSNWAEGVKCEDGYFVSASSGEYKLWKIKYVWQLEALLKAAGCEEKGGEE